MAGGTGRHGRPDEPDDVASDHEGTGVTSTQPLPIVRREESGPELQPVRAVAKRVPSALPALGRDEVSDLPHSARTSADRRRRAREETDGPAELGAESAGAHTADPPPLAVPGPRPQPEIERVPVISTDATPDVTADVELVPVGSRSREKPGAPTPVAAADQADQLGRHSAPAEESAAPRPEPTPRSEPAPPPAPPPTLPPTPPTMGQPGVEPGHPEIIEATIVDESPRPYASTNTQTDEWVTVPPGAPGPPALPAAASVGPPTESSGEALPRRAPGSAALATRPPRLPPPPLPPGPGGHSDTWETTPLPPVGDDYEGRRRRRRRRLTVSPWLVVLAVVVALSAAVAVPFLFAGGGGAEPDVEANPSQRTSDPVSSAPSGSSTGLPIIPAPSVSASSSSTPSASTTATPSGSGTSTATTGPSTQTSTTTSNPPPPFALTIQAEAGGSSTGWDSGAERDGGVIDRLGDNWQGEDGGWVEFRNITVPEPGAQYRLRIWYVFRDWAQEYPRRMTVVVNGSTAFTSGELFRVETPTVLEVTATLGSGTNTIRITDPNRPCPAIDRIEISGA